MGNVGAIHLHRHGPRQYGLPTGESFAQRSGGFLSVHRPLPFGHYGDGNIHYNISQPRGADKDAYLARWEEVSDAVHAIVLLFGGSISAEHGIGRMKAEALESVKSPVELAMMRRLKHAFDPRGILNPGKVLLVR